MGWSSQSSLLTACCGHTIWLHSCRPHSITCIRTIVPPSPHTGGCNLSRAPHCQVVLLHRPDCPALACLIFVFFLTKELARLSHVVSSAAIAGRWRLLCLQLMAAAAAERQCRGAAAGQQLCFTTTTTTTPQHTCSIWRRQCCNLPAGAGSLFKHACIRATALLHVSCGQRQPGAYAAAATAATTAAAAATAGGQQWWWCSAPSSATTCRTAPRPGLKGGKLGLSRVDSCAVDSCLALSRPSAFVVLVQCVAARCQQPPVHESQPLPA